MGKANNEKSAKQLTGMNNSYLKAWQETTAEEKRAIFRDAGDNIGLPAAAIEKDWWVTYTLKLIFSMEVAAHTVFKGGTSLSKAWNLIDRFSEDIDLALDRKFLGFGDKMSASQVKRLREHSFKYISENFFPLLQKTFQDAGFNEVTLQLRETKANDQDPLIIELYYPGITTLPEYIQPRVLVEIGSRSLMEPYSQISFSSMAGEYYKGESFADETITIPTVNPERTFLEKIFLLHEEFQRPADKMKINRLSRHLYDIEKTNGHPVCRKNFIRPAPVSKLCSA
jgi:hypothetical protein